MNRKWTLVAILAALGVGSMIFARNEVEAEDRADKPAIEITTITVTPSEIEESVSIPAVVQAVEEGRLGFPVGGRVMSRSVRVGDRIKAGDLIAKLDGRGFSNAVKIAEASLKERSEQRAQLIRDAERTRALGKQGAVTSVSLEQTESGLERAAASERAAAASLQESKRRRQDTVLRAPFDGVVTEVFAEPGEVIGVGQPIIRLVGNTGLEVVVEVNATTVAAIKNQDVVAIESLDGVREDATVRTVIRRATTEAGLHPVAIDLSSDTALFSGANVDVTITTKGSPKTIVPVSAIVDPSGQRPFVWRVNNDKAKRVFVQFSGLVENGVAVDGLEPNDVIITHGFTRLLDGDAVVIKNEDQPRAEVAP